MYNLIEYSDNYSKTSGSLWQYFKDIPAVNDNGNIVHSDGANATDSFNFKIKMTGQTDDDGEMNNIEIMIALRYLSKFQRTLENSLINCEVNLTLTWSESCVIVYTNIANQGVQLEIKDAKLYVPVITLSIEDNEKLLSQLKPDFERTIKWNKYLTKPGLLRQSPDSNHLVEPKNRLFVLEFENDTQRTSSKRYYLPNVEIKAYNAMIDVKKFFDQPIKSNKVTYENIRKIAAGEGDYCTTGCLLDHT